MQTYWAVLNVSSISAIPIVCRTHNQLIHKQCAPAAEHSQNPSFACVTGSAIACIQPISAAGPMLMQLAYVCSSVSRVLSERKKCVLFCVAKQQRVDKGIVFCQAYGQSGDMVI